MNAKIILKLSTICTALITVISCSNSQQKSIEKIAGLFNNGLFQLNEVEKTDFEFVLNYTLSEEYSSYISQDLNMTSQNMKRAIIATIRNEVNVEWLIETLQDLNLTWRMKLKNSVTGEEYDFAILPSDLEILLTSDNSIDGLTPEQKRIAQSADMENASCPSKIDEGLILSSIRYTDGNIVYTYEVNEEINGLVKGFYENSKEMEDNIKAFFSSDMSQLFVNQCAKANANIYFDYFGQLSGQTFRYVFDTKTQIVTYSLI